MKLQFLIKPRWEKSLSRLLMLSLLLTLTGVGSCGESEEDEMSSNDPSLESILDSKRVLENPHKGWFHHYYDDNHVRYPIGEDANIDNFPGFDHMYFRIPWSALETADDVYNWDVIDDVVNKWYPKGIKIGVQVTCKETYNIDGAAVAVPQWLIDAGASGEMLSMPDWNASFWEPDYSDPIFLEKLEEFHQAFAARYDGKPYMTYIDIGSYGSWGEGHNWPVSQTVWPKETIFKHLDIYLNAYQETQLTLSDDWVFEHRSDADSKAIKAYVDGAERIAWRDNSVLVDWWINNLPAEQYSVAHPEIYAETYLEKPVVIELDHYVNVMSAGNWSVPNGSAKGGAIVNGAVELMHASYVGFHGVPGDYLSDNPELVAKVANKMGYWYFPLEINMPSAASPGEAVTVEMKWENRGVAPAYHKFSLLYTLTTVEGDVVHEGAFDEANNLDWMPNELVSENYQLELPEDLAAGSYELAIRLFDETSGRTVHPALKSDVMNAEGYYNIYQLDVK